MKDLIPIRVLISFIFYLIAIIGFNFIPASIYQYIENNKITFLLTIFLGLITFSIPFLWNAYQKFLSKTELLKEESINGIINKVYYENGIIYFDIFIQYLLGIMLIFGLFINIILPLNFSLIILFFFLLYLFFLPQTFKAIDNQSWEDLKDILQKQKLDFSDEKTIYTQLWIMDDSEILKKYKMNKEKIFNYFIKAIRTRSEDECFELILIYNNNIDKRTIDYIFMTSNLRQLLDLYFYYFTDKSQITARRPSIKASLLTILRLVLLKHPSELHLMLFGEIDKHIESHKQNKDYLNSLFSLIFQQFIFSDKEDKNEYIIKDFFPLEWLLTLNNFQKNKEIFTAIFIIYRKWASRRISSNYVKRDSYLELINMQLFPDCEPITWGMIFLLSLINPENINDVRFIIEELSQKIGGLGITISMWESELPDDYEAQIFKAKQSTFRLAQEVFQPRLSISHLTSLINNLNELEKEYKKKPNAELLNRMDKYIKLVSEMIAFYKSNK